MESKLSVMHGKHRQVTVYGEPGRSRRYEVQDPTHSSSPEEKDRSID